MKSTVASLVAIVVSLCVASNLAAQDIRYEKYKLDNGMTVILHPDHAVPVAAVNIWYRVGSKDEPVRRSGFAHLFEHLMFMGTQRVPGNEFDQLMEAGGGSNNASTSSDRTNYFSSGPASLLPTLLWLDADRLEDLGRMMDQVKLDKQRDIVRNERRQSYENRPYGRAELKIQDLMFPAGHPYHIPVIGTHEDLEAATVADVKEFFANYYVPNNAALCVAGDFDPATIKPLIAGLFGTLPRGAQPERRSAGPVHLDSVRHATMLDQVQLPMVAMAFHSPAQFADGDAEMDLVAAILSDGKSSRLYKRLVFDDRVAVSVNAYQDSSELGSTFRVDVMANPDADLDRIERTVDEELARLVKDGPTAEELQRHQASVELRLLTRLQSIESRADKLNEYEYFWGEPNSFKRDLDRFRNATVQGVRKWAEQVLKPKARVIMRVLPESAQRPANPRDKRPGPLAGGAFDPPKPATFKLKNGLTVMLWEKHELPLVAAELLLSPGAVLDAPGRAGTAAMLADMLDEGAGDRDALQFADALQNLGAEFGAQADRESLAASLTVLKRRFGEAAALVADAVIRPRLAEADWDRIRRVALEELRQQDEEPTIVAGRVAARLLYGEDHPFGWPVAGTPETVEKLALTDIRAAHAAICRPDAATLLLAGDLTADEARAALEPTLGAWPVPTGAPLAVPPARPTPKGSALRVAIVDRPGAVQTVITFALPGPAFAGEQRVPYRLLGTVLGGSFTSRLNINLREDKGYTYGARAGYRMARMAGSFFAGSSVKADKTGPALIEFLKELRGLRTGDVKPAELTKARETIRTDVVQAFQGVSGTLSEAAERVSVGAGYESLAADMTALQAVAVDELNKLANAAVPLEQGVLVLVGDRGLILEQIKSLGLPTPQDVDARGRPVTKSGGAQTH